MRSSPDREVRTHGRRRVPSIVWPAAVIMAAALMLFPWFRDRKEPSPASPTPPAPASQAATKAEVESAVSTAAELMPDLSVTPQPLPVIDRDPKDRVLTYLVEAKKTNEFWFDRTHYQLGQGTDGSDPTNLDFTELVRAIDHASETRTPFGQAVTGALNLNFEGGPVSGGVTIDNVPLDRLGQLLGLVRNVVKLDVQRVDVAVKGWADGEKHVGWAPPVKHLPDWLKRFSVLYPADDSHELSLFYKKPEQERTVTDPYTNADLPDLRAQYIRWQFIEPVTGRTDNHAKCKVYVLHSEPLPAVEHPEWRKVQVWVMVYLTPEPKG